MGIIFLYILGGCVLGSLAYAAISLAPRAPTRTADIEQIHEVADLHDGQLFVELGCGHSAVSRGIAKRNPGVHVVGIELAFPLYLYSYILHKITGPSNLTLVYGNALKYDFGTADVFYVFGLPKTVNAHLKQKAEQEMKPGAKLISYQFALKNRVHGSLQKITLKKGVGMLCVYTKHA